MNKIYYSYEDFKLDVKFLLKMIDDFKPETLLGISRGGLTLSHFIAQGLNNRNLFTINSVSYEGTQQISKPNISNIPNLKNSKNVLIIDDIVDSGLTIKEVLDKLKDLYPNTNFKVASIFYNENAIIKPDYFIKFKKDWIDFFWEIDYK